MNLLKTAFNIAMFVFGLAVMFTIFQLIFTYVEIFKVEKTVDMNGKKWKVSKGSKTKLKGGKFVLNTDKITEVDKGTLTKISDMLTNNSWTSPKTKKDRKKKNALKRKLSSLKKKLIWNVDSLIRVSVVKPKNIKTSDWTKKIEVEGSDGEYTSMKAQQELNWRGKNTNLSFSFGKGIKKAVGLGASKSDKKKAAEAVKAKNLVPTLLSMLNVKGVDSNTCLGSKRNGVYLSSGRIDGKLMCTGDKLKWKTDMEDDGNTYYTDRIKKKFCNTNCAV